MEQPTQMTNVMDDTASMQALAVVEDRQAKYGSPQSNFADIGSLVQTVLKEKLKDGTIVHSTDVALIMIGVKLSREAFKHSRDNIIDIIGYAECLDRIYEQK